jgi:hypothetical protein
MTIKRGPGRPPKMASIKRGPGRPKGSQNKPKEEVIEIAKRGPGRPPKKVVETGIAGVVVKRGPGRPKGSKNKKLTVRRRGRPLGSKNKKKPGRKPLTIWQKIEKHLSKDQYVPCSMIADKIGMHQKFVSAILTRKEHTGEVKKTRVKHEFKGYNKAYGYKLCSGTLKSKKSA